MFGELKKEEITALFTEVYHDLSIQDTEIGDFIVNIFKEGYNSYTMYHRVRDYFPSEIDQEFKEEIFEAIKTKNYDNVETILEGKREYFEKIINNSLKRLGEEKIVALNNLISSNMFTISPGTRSMHMVQKGKIDFLIYFEKDLKIYYKGVPLILRKYTEK